MALTHLSQRDRLVSAINFSLVGQLSKRAYQLEKSARGKVLGETLDPGEFFKNRRSQGKSQSGHSENFALGTKPIEICFRKLSLRIPAALIKRKIILNFFKFKYK